MTESPQGPPIPPALDEVLHQQTRLRIVTTLVAEREADFVYLRKLLDISEGKLNGHMKVLLSGGYVEARKSFVNSRPRTSYRLTRGGRKSFDAYINQLEELVRNFSR